MTQPERWDAEAALGGLQEGPWAGSAWRFHRGAYGPTDAGGSLLVSGRYHRASDQFARSDVWAALYLALAPEVSLGEILRHFSPELLPTLRGYRVTELEVELQSVLDCREASTLGLSPEDLVKDYDFETTHAIASAAIARGAEAILVRSATGLGDNLVAFPAQFRRASRLTVVRSRDPRLYVPRG